MNKPIAFVGYMGCGKTYWGKRVANRLNIRFLDLDGWLVEKHLHTTISSFIQEKGELALRKIERASLNEITRIGGQLVLSTGGGTPCYYDNMDVLNANFTTIYLDCSINTLTERLVREKAQRPLIAHVPDAELREFIAKHLFERRHYYHQAKVKIKAEDLELETLLHVIENHED
jgi:shikimate kinase